MKIIITGHTSGIGKYLYDYYSDLGNEVIGISRETGYNINTQQLEIIDLAVGSDLFINNANSGSAQKDLLVQLNKSVKKIITMGSITTNYSDILKNADKEELEKTHRYLSLDPDSSEMLLLKPSFIESTNANQIISDYTISYKDIVNSIEFWFDNPKVSAIEFSCKLTIKTANSMIDHGIDAVTLRRRIADV